MATPTKPRLVSLDQPQRAKTPAERSKAYRQRRKLAAAAPESDETLIAPDFLPAALEKTTHSEQSNCGVDCALRLIATTRYDGLRPPATIDCDHLLRLIATTHSGRSRPACGRV
jgi:hypothetical protein